MTLRARISKIEQTRPAYGADMLDLDLPPDLHARIDATKAAGLGLAALESADLEAIVAAADVARGRA